MTGHEIVTGHEFVRPGRRYLFAIGGAALLTGAIPGRSGAAETSGSEPGAAIEQLNGALLAAMKSGGRVPFGQRYSGLAPVVERVFDLPTVLARSVGPTWATMPPAQKAALGDAFLRYTVSSYVSSFDSYNGQSFQVLPSSRATGDGGVVVRSQLVRADGSPVELDYVMRNGANGWQVVDVLTNGAISRVAVQRSDFRQLLSSGGVPALTASLEHKVANLAG